MARAVLDLLEQEAGFIYLTADGRRTMAGLHGKVAPIPADLDCESEGLTDGFSIGPRIFLGVLRSTGKGNLLETKGIISLVVRSFSSSTRYPGDCVK